jgi:hypothetical protein
VLDGVVLGDTGAHAVPVLPGGTEHIVLGVDDDHRGVIAAVPHDLHRWRGVRGIPVSFLRQPR